ncbi:MAG: sodium:proton antiporter [Bacteroidetes bacterium GWA2_31_9]|nr:MAG: sodium:proton antiporter [Bacteroidetes bacterium GWA2_31_9]
MFITMVVIFVLGYIAIALEHPLKIDKAASALFIGVAVWVAYILGGEQILSNQSGAINGFMDYLKRFPDSTYIDFIAHHEILEHLAEISEILFFLLGAMTIVEIVDQHGGFEIITSKIKTTKKVKLLWILTIVTFFMSAVLDNLTTTIVMIALLRKLVGEQKDRWFFASMIVLAANAGGAFSPIGDVTTIMLWVKGQITTGPIIRDVFLPSIVAAIAPLALLSFTMKGKVQRPEIKETDEHEYTTTTFERNLIFFVGVGSLLFVPVFKTLTHLPPYMGMLLGLSILWITTELLHRKKSKNEKAKLVVVGVLRRVDTPTILFFLGILSAVAALQSAGHLSLLASWLDSVTNKNVYVINSAIGILSSVIDNVPLVAGAMGMYDLASVGQFTQDGIFWQLLAYCAGTGGSILIIGSAAGVAAMGLEKIDFIWYMKNISLLALLGYFAGIGTYWLMHYFHIVGV